MKTLVHLSDLHFGRDRPELMDPLISHINDLGPDLVVISGDLTQRARWAQFQRAREFIDALSPATLVIPGNHDTPLDNLVERMFTPWRRYRKWISPDLQPQVQDPDWIVIGINSVNPLGWQRGWFDRRAIRTVRKGFQHAANSRFRIVTAHHPLEHLPGEKKRLMRGAGRAIGELADLGTDIFLSGHLHSWRADVFAAHHDHPSLLQIHAGTGLSDRLRGEENDFNLVTLRDTSVEVTRFACLEGRTHFERAAEVHFLRTGSGWTRTGQ